MVHMKGGERSLKISGPSKSHQWFKSYGHFTEGVDYANWWSFSGGGSALQPAQEACFSVNPLLGCFGLVVVISVYICIFTLYM